MGSLLWFSSVKWLPTTGDSGLSMWFILFLHLLYIYNWTVFYLTFLTQQLRTQVQSYKQNKSFFHYLNLLIFSLSKLVLDILSYGVQKVRINHPRWYYHLNFQYRVFGFAICLSFCFRAFCTFWICCFFDHDRYPYLKVAGIPYVYWWVGFCRCDGVGGEIDIFSEKLVGYLDYIHIVGWIWMMIVLVK